MSIVLDQHLPCQWKILLFVSALLKTNGFDQNQYQQMLIFSHVIPCVLHIPLQRRSLSVYLLLFFFYLPVTSCTVYSLHKMSASATVEQYFGYCTNFLFFNDLKTNSVQEGISQPSEVKLVRLFMISLCCIFTIILLFYSIIVT